MRQSHFYLLSDHQSMILVHVQLGRNKKSEENKTKNIMHKE